jgi:hypothetical protein
MTISIRSAAFAGNARVPVRHTGDGEDVSPPIAWSNVPDGARELALICDDPDAPRADPWVHWVTYGIPASVTELPESVPTSEAPAQPSGALQGKNSWGTVGYRGPAPPEGHGLHHYHFKLYALDQPLNLAPGTDKAALLAAMEGHVLAHGELIGTYER